MGGRCHRNRDHLMRWMHLRLHAPLGAFGGESVDARGVIRDFPAQSMMTGLIANALGWSRTMTEEHQALQDRIVFGALWEDDVPLGRLTDYQTGSLNKDDQAWTTRGAPARRAGGPGTYEGSHQRWRDYHSDLRLAVVLRFDPGQRLPDRGPGRKRPGTPGPAPVHRPQALPSVRTDLRGVDRRAERARCTHRDRAQRRARLARVLAGLGRHRRCGSHHEHHGRAQLLDRSSWRRAPDL